MAQWQAGLTLELKKRKGERPQKEGGTWGVLEGLDDCEVECQGKWRPSGLQTTGR